MYQQTRRKPAYFDYDLIVIGTGSGGGVAAHMANRSGKKVAVIEAGSVGGECPNFGCVPTKALLQAAETYHTATTASRFGIKTRDVKIDYPKVKAWKDHAVECTGSVDGEEFFANEGIKVMRGYAHFLNKWTVSVNHKRYSAKKFLIATGTKSLVPPIPGLSGSGYMTYRQAIDLTSLPESVFVIGGGAIGCEFSHFFATLGSKVIIADLAPRLVALEDPEVGELLGALFTKKGVSVHTGARVTRITTKGKYKTVHFEKDGQSHQVTVTHILLASGKAPNTDLGLENAGVEYDRTGIKVNEYMQTANKHIYAAGDVVGPFRFTHMASYQSRVAVHNMYHRKIKTIVSYRAVPRCVFTEPEIACVGASESQLQASKAKYRKAAVPITVVGRANTSGVSSGFVKVLASPKGRVLGACIVSPRAGELIHEIGLAINKGLTARDIAETIHAFPTWSEAVRVACQKLK